MKPHCLLFSATILTLLGTTTSAQAQDSGGESDDTQIIVEGTIEVDGTVVRQQAREITQRANSSSEPVARWQRPVCAGVYGLSLENAIAIINRIHDVAELAGLEVDPDLECAANLWVIIVDDPAETFADLREESGWMLRGLEGPELNRIEAQSGPIRAWTLASTRTEDGRPIPIGREAVMLAQEAFRRGEIPWNENWNMSRLRTSIRRDIDGSFVLVQRSAIGSIDAYALADYAAMRMLARTDEPRENVAFTTVLSLFSDEMAPQRVTAFDRAYLRSINLGSAYRPSSSGLPSLDELMVEELLREAGQLVED